MPALITTPAWRDTQNVNPIGTDAWFVRHLTLVLTPPYTSGIGVSTVDLVPPDTEGRRWVCRNLCLSALAPNIIAFIDGNAAAPPPISYLTHFYFVGTQGGKTQAWTDDRGLFRSLAPIPGAGGGISLQVVNPGTILSLTMTLYLEASDINALAPPT
jgi:hypothetical protein